MTLSQIDAYLNASREYINNSRRQIAQMGFCCPAVFLGSLMDRQSYLERAVWNERHRDGAMGIWWLGVGVISAAATFLGAYVYDHYTKAKMQSDYLDCLNRYQADFGMSPGDAAKVCGGGSEGLKADITSTIRIGIYGAITIMSLYVASKILSKKR